MIKGQEHASDDVFTLQFKTAVMRLKYKGSSTNKLQNCVSLSCVYTKKFLKYKFCKEFNWQHKLNIFMNTTKKLRTKS